MNRSDWEQGRSDDVLTREAWARWERALWVDETGTVRLDAPDVRIAPSLWGDVPVLVEGNRVGAIRLLRDRGVPCGWHDVSDFSPEAGPSTVHPTMGAAALAVAAFYLSPVPESSEEPF